jgi:hypothetical protein
LRFQGFRLYEPEGLIGRCGCYETSFHPTAGDGSAHLKASTKNIRAGEAALSKRTVTDPVRRISILQRVVEAVVHRTLPSY